MHFAVARDKWKMLHLTSDDELVYTNLRIKKEKEGTDENG